MEHAVHTLDHVDCPACAEARQAVMHSHYPGKCRFRDAAALYLSNRKGLADRTRRGCEADIAALNTFFGELALRDIHIGHVETYQKVRQAEIRSHPTHKGHQRRNGDAPRESDGASRINHEVSLLGRVLKQAGLWADLKNYYEPLPLPKESAGMALTPEEEEHLMKVARSRPRWMVAYCCALISRGTTAGPGEIRHLRRGDVELDRPVPQPDGTVHYLSFLHVREGVKNAFRERPLPLMGDAERAMRWLLERATANGSVEEHHYVLFHRALNQKSAPDPTRPMGSWKKAHRAMCLEAAKKFPRLAHFRPYDYRHTAATDMLENPAISFTTIEHMLGHRLHSNTKRHYDHLRNAGLAAAAAALNRGHAKPPEPVDPLVYGTKQPRPDRQQAGNLYQFPKRR